VLLALLDFPEDQDFQDFLEFLLLQFVLQLLEVQGFPPIPAFPMVQLVQLVLERLESHCSLQHHLVQVHPADLPVLGIQHYLEVHYHLSLQLLPAVLVYRESQECR